MEVRWQTVTPTWALGSKQGDVVGEVEFMTQHNVLRIKMTVHGTSGPSAFAGEWKQQEVFPT